jgi:Zn-dependent peptidase ImmA (M78 family)
MGDSYRGGEKTLEGESMKRDPLQPFIEPDPLLAKAERTAMASVACCIGTDRLLDAPLPIPVEQWVELRFGIEFGVEEIPTVDGRPVLGFATHAPPRIVISQALIDDEPRLRFTVAHELGHVIMHEDIDLLPREFGATSVWSREHPIERQADRFAAALLMPGPLMLREMRRCCLEANVETMAALRELATGSDTSLHLWQRVFIPELQKRFAVSREAVLFRLLGLRLGDGAPLLLMRHVVRLAPHAA